jgi:hypothetical protein
VGENRKFNALAKNIVHISPQQLHNQNEIADHKGHKENWQKALEYEGVKSFYTKH